MPNKKPRFIGFIRSSNKFFKDVSNVRKVIKKTQKDKLKMVLKQFE